MCFDQFVQVVNGKSYSDYKKDTFECGKFELLCKIKGENCTNLERHKGVPEEALKGNKDLRADKNNFDSFSYDNEETGAFCGATIINDR